MGFEAGDLTAWCYTSADTSATWTPELVFCYLAGEKVADRLFKVQCNFLDYHSFPGFFLLFISLNEEGDSVWEIS